MTLAIASLLTGACSPHADPAAAEPNAADTVTSSVDVTLDWTGTDRDERLVSAIVLVSSALAGGAASTRELRIDGPAVRVELPDGDHRIEALQVTVAGTDDGRGADDSGLRAERTRDYLAPILVEHTRTVRVTRGTVVPSEVRLDLRRRPLESSVQFRVTYGNGRAVRGTVLELSPRHAAESVTRWVTDHSGIACSESVPRGESAYRLTSGTSFALSENWDVSPPTRIEGVVSTDDPDSAFPVIRIEPVEGSRVVVELSDLTGLDPETLPPGRIISLCRKWGEAGWSSLPVAPTWTRAPAEDDAVIAFETASAIPAGTYSIGVRIPGRILASSLVELPSGSTERVRLSPGPRGPSISFRLSGPESMASRRLHVSFNPIRDRPGGDVVHCMVPPDGTPTEFSGLRPGAYVALIWDLGLARTVSIGSDSTELSLELPPESPCPVGTTSLAVDVSPGRRRLPRGFLVAIRPNGNDERADDGWSAFRVPGRSFDAIAPGSYEVRVYNGALGSWIPGRAGVTSRRVDVAPAGTRTLVDLEPEK